MNTEQIILVLGIAITLVVIVTMIVTMTIGRKVESELESKIEGESTKQSTYFLDEGEDEKICDICYGRIGEDAIAECVCGRTFHDVCAQPTGSCPYCGVKHDDMTTREPIRTRCPACGRFMKAGICICGTFIPRKDGTFQCACGGRVDVTRPLCRKCGAIYQSVTTQRYKNPK